MRAYSVDLRQRVLAALDRGMVRQEVVTTFGVSQGTLTRLLRQRRTQADIRPRRPSGRRPTITVDQHPHLWAQLEAHPDATLAQHTTWWNQAQGTSLSHWTVGRAIRRLGWTYKKRRWVPPSATSRRAPHFASGSSTVPLLTL